MGGGWEYVGVFPPKNSELFVKSKNAPIKTLKFNLCTVCSQTGAEGLGRVSKVGVFSTFPIFPKEMRPL